MRPLDGVEGQALWQLSRLWMPPKGSVQAWVDLQAEA